MTEGVDLDVDEGVATLSWSRAHRRNAMDARTALLVHDRLVEVGRSDDVAVVVLAPRGGTFCAGWDIDDLAGLQDASPEDLSERLREMDRLMFHLRRTPVPVLARVQGDALGFGVSLVSACAGVIAARSARFGLPEIALGMPPVMAAVDVIDALGERELLRWALDGQPRTAEQAQHAGLVTEVVDDGALDEAVARVAASIARHPCAAVRQTVSTMRDLAAVSGHRRRTLGRELTMDALGSGAATAGVAAFATRRAETEDEV